MWKEWNLVDTSISQQHCITMKPGHELPLLRSCENSHVILREDKKNECFFNIDQGNHIRRTKKNSIVSILYVGYHDFIPSIFDAFHRFILVAFFITKFKTSSTRSNKNGDKGSPWQRLRWSMNGTVGEPLTSMNAEVVVTQDEIQCRHLGGKSTWVRVQ